jgi:hypothetical protein
MTPYHALSSSAIGMGFSMNASTCSRPSRGGSNPETKITGGGASSHLIDRTTVDANNRFVHNAQFADNVFPAVLLPALLVFRAAERLLLTDASGEDSESKCKLARNCQLTAPQYLLERASSLDRIGR